MSPNEIYQLYLSNKCMVKSRITINGNLVLKSVERVQLSLNDKINININVINKTNRLNHWYEELQFIEDTEHPEFKNAISYTSKSDEETDKFEGADITFINWDISDMHVATSDMIHIATLSEAIKVYQKFVVHYWNSNCIEVDIYTYFTEA